MIDGKFLKAIRLEQKKSRKQVANAIKRDESTIKKWETNLRRMSIDSIQKLAKYYKVSESLITSSESLNIENAKHSISNLAVIFEKDYYILKMHMINIIQNKSGTDVNQETRNMTARMYEMTQAWKLLSDLIDERRSEIKDIVDFLQKI